MLIISLKSPSASIYQTTIVSSTTANNLFATAGTRTIVVSSLLAGLYINTYSLYIVNSSQTTANLTNIRFALASSIGYDCFNENDYHPFSIAVNQNQTFSKMCIANNPSTYNFTLSTTPTYTGGTGGGNGVTWMSLGNTVSP